MRFVSLLLALAFAAAVTCDRCTFTRGKAYDFDDALDCLYSIPLKEEVFNQTLETIEKAGQLYVFKDVSKKSPSPVFYPMNIDFDKEVAAIRSKHYDSEWAFNADIVNLFGRYQDGHFAYVPPLCYTGFAAMQPFSLVSYYDKETSSEVILIAGIMNGAEEGYKKLYGVSDLRDFVGGIVRTINGEDAAKVIYRYASEKAGSSHDANIRYNMALTCFLGNGAYYPGEFYYRSALHPFPERGEKMSYVVEMPHGGERSLDLKWIFVAKSDNDSEESLAQSCFPAKVAKDTKFDQKPIRLEPRMQLSESELALLNERTQRGVPKRVGDEPIPIITSADVSFFQLDKKTAVIQIPTFGPSNMRSFGRTLKQGFKKIAERKLSRVIVDVSNNGGGIICLGYTVARMLIPEYHPYGANDMAVVPLSLAYAQAAIDRNVTDTYWSPTMWYKADSNETLANDMSWFVPGVNHTRGGVEGTYSELFRDSCDIYFKVLPPPEGLDFTPDEVKVLTNGYCFSTCALLSRHMQEYTKVETVVVGGVQGKPMGIATTPGGQVNDLATTLQMAEKLGMADHPLSPPGFPNSARMTYTLREVYPWQKTYRDIPLEFFFQPATHHIPYTRQSAIEPTAVWKDVIQFFKE